MYTYFSQRDFDRCRPPCSMHDMDEPFMQKLDYARELAGIPFILNSAYRSVDWEYKQGRDGSSSHCKRVAVDIKATGSRQRFIILKALIAAGFTRIGVGKEFIHVDDDPDKDQEVIFHYYP